MISPISIAVYHNRIKGAHENTQNCKVVAFMVENNYPMSIRMLHKKMLESGYNIDIVSLRRSVHNLEKGRNCASVLEIAYKDTCPVTGEKVGFYRLKSTQLNLFR